MIDVHLCDTLRRVHSVSLLTSHCTALHQMTHNTLAECSDILQPTIIPRSIKSVMRKLVQKVHNKPSSTGYLSGPIHGVMAGGGHHDTHIQRSLLPLLETLGMSNFQLSVCPVDFYTTGVVTGAALMAGLRSRHSPIIMAFSGTVYHSLSLAASGEDSCILLLEEGSRLDEWHQSPMLSHVKANFIDGYLRMGGLNLAEGPDSRFSQNLQLGAAGFKLSSNPTTALELAEANIALRIKSSSTGSLQLRAMMFLGDELVKEEPLNVVIDGCPGINMFNKNEDILTTRLNLESNQIAVQAVNLAVTDMTLPARWASLLKLVSQPCSSAWSGLVLREILAKVASVKAGEPWDSDDDWDTAPQSFPLDDDESEES